ANMSIVDDAEYKNALHSCWSIETDFAKWFPDEIAEWIQYQSTILGVAQPYLSIPLLVAVSYCSHQCSVTAGANHTEPLILYGLVVGRSGTNKSAALHKILDIVKSIEVSESHTFESGTMEGLLVAMRENEESILAVYDEFSSFYDSLDKGTAGKCEKSRFLTLYNGKPWSKKTKTNGTMEIDSPRYNMLAFTQPSYAVQFAKTNTSDGFYQRFLLSVPKERFVKFNDKRECLNNKKELLDLESVIKRIYEAAETKWSWSLLMRPTGFMNSYTMK
uniref:DUF3987 domain-containing protein n=1 Tax=Clytia hemisphaerica TaxID=252671 RepID=A0A7M5XL40_9CNID